MSGMKRELIFIFLISIQVLTGCDALRKLAGRPTKAEIEAKRLELLRQQEASHQARIDSLKKVEKELADSLTLAGTLRQSQGTVLNPGAIGGLFTTKLEYKYYVVVGAFIFRRNAENLHKTVQAKGYVPTIINFRNGFNAIGLCPTNDLNAALASLRKVRQEDFCPEDVWILVNN